MTIAAHHPCENHGLLALQGAAALEKILLQFIPNNPLISLDSDERIQGNPTRKSLAFIAKLKGCKKTQISLRSRREAAHLHRRNLALWVRQEF
jgi:hypothetical protein